MKSNSVLQKITKNKIILIQLGIAVAMAAILLTIFLIYRKKLGGQEISDSCFQYEAGIRFDYTGEISLLETQDGVQITDSAGTYDSCGYPILFDDRTHLIITEKMLYMDSENGTSLSRVPMFTDVAWSNGSVVFSLNGQKAAKHGGFLYDGKDLYIFLEDTTLNIGGKEIFLSAGSYVVMRYDQDVEYFNTGDGSDVFSAIYDTNVEAVGTSCWLDVGRDLIYIDGQEAMLYTAVDNIKTIEMTK